ncbi:hypothetical protein ACET3Z_025121 [Daucus carota]
MTRDSEDTASNKSCFSGILRRILCTGSLPTHPSDSDIVPGSDDLILEKKNIQVKGQGTPGVVARLMGLESLPDIKWVPKDAVNLRSRSVRSADYFPQFHHLSEESQHRRVKTSVSFREIPTFLHQQNEDLFVVCFDKRDGNNASEDIKNLKSGSRSARGNIKDRVAVKKKEKQQSKKRNAEPKKSYVKGGHVLPYYTKSNEVYIRSGPRIQKKRPTKARNRYCKEEVSSGIKHARMRENRRTSSHARIGSSSSTGSCSESTTTTSEDSRKAGQNFFKQSKTAVTRENQITESEDLVKSKVMNFYIKNLAEVCRLNEEDAESCHDWKWIKPESLKFDDSGDICLEFEQCILDTLLQQLVDELC